MLANELIDCLQKVIFKHFFLGIFAANTIPRKIKDKQFMIINNDYNTGPGKHWYAIARFKNLIECFDSLGINSEERKTFIFNHFKFRGTTHVIYNTSQLQPLSSILCGQFVLYYLFERYHNLDLTFDDLLNEIFNENLSQNDDIVLNFMNDFFH